MNKSILSFIVLIVVVVSGWYAYKQQSEKQVQDSAAGGSTSTMSASFSCVDGTHFIAEFAKSDSVNIIVDGVTVRTVPRVDGAGQRFEDSLYVYVFAGEEVSVANKATGKTTTCSQPVDPNNAPMNFGDRGEGAGSQQPSIAIAAAENIQGKWQSNEDAKFVREFKADGTINDWYESKIVTSGHWTAFTKASAPALPYPMQDGTVYLQVTEAGSQEDTMYFAVIQVTPETLQLMYLTRGNMQSYTRIQ